MAEKIVRYSNKYKDELKAYIHKTHPLFSPAYVDYVAENAVSPIDDHHSFLVIGENDEIVGTHMLYNTKALINGTSINTAWGHDTYLNENLRHSFGLDFVIEINNEGHFGIGLSEVNRRLHKKMRSTMWENLYNYCFPTFSLPLSLILRPNKVKPKYKLAKKNGAFTLCESLDTLRIPNEGFWNKDYCDIDFIRDSVFFERRFFTNRVHPYYVYQLDGEFCYFVVRYVVFKHVPTLFIVDYRYDRGKKEQMQSIFKAATSLANHSKLGMVLLMSNDAYTDAFLSKKRFLLKRSTDYIASRCLGLNNKMTSFVTAADSDVDFIRG